MNIPKGTTDQLFKSLAEYNPATNEAMSKIAKVLVPLGIAMSVLWALATLWMALSGLQFKQPNGLIPL